MSVYRVVGRHRYRDHEPGEIFEASIHRDAERRALARGDIEVLEHSQPGLQPGSFTLPAGWPTTDQREE